MIKNWLFRIVIFLLLLFPVVFVLLISNQEIDRYQPQESIIRSQQAFGYGEKIIVGQIEESYPLIGTIDSVSFESIFIPANSTNYYLFQKQDELFAGKALYMTNGKTITSTVSGMVYDILSKPDGIEVIVKTTDELVLVGNLNTKQTLEINKTYYTEDEKELTLLSIKDVYTEKGQEVIFSVNKNDFQLNQIINTYLLTGKIQQGVLLAPTDCIYQGPTNQDTIRIISKDGKVLREQEVTVSIRSHYSAAVNGVDEGELCDIEYGRFQSSDE